MIKRISNNKTLYIDNEVRVEYKLGSLRIVRMTDDQLINEIGLMTKKTDYILSKIPLFERLLRLGPRYFEKAGENTFIFSMKGGLYLLDIINHRIEKIFTYARGTNNPLYFCSYVRKGIQEIVFGDYWGHDNKNNVGIYRYSHGIVKKISTIPGDKIDHIHRVEYDGYRDCYWIMTGDSDNGSGIWTLGYNATTPIPFLVGKQMYRTCVFFLTEKGFIYATDSQLERNHLYYVDCRMKTVKELAELPGSCIYGLSFYDETGKKHYCVSTVVETDSNVRNWRYYINNKLGRSIDDNYCHLFVGNMKKGFKEYWKIEKDFLPMALFQFGNILFPSQHVDEKIYFCPQACIESGTFELNISSDKERKNV